MAIAGLYHFTERNRDGSGQPILDTDNGEEMMYIQPSVAVALNNNPPESPGILYISTKRVIWFSDVDQNKGYAVDFLFIALHAVSRDPEAYPSPCIYMQIEIESTEEESEGSDAESNEHPELSKITEMRLVPADPSQLDAIFSVFCECAELNPEPVEDEGEENEWIFSAEQMEDDGTVEDSEWHFSENPGNPIGYANGDHELAQTVLELRINDQRFEDAEETEHGGQGGRQ